jgi:predicted solute-binding protein
MAGFGAVYRRGISNLDAIAMRESPGHGLSPTAIRSYLTKNIRFELGRREAKGMDLFGHMLADLDAGFAASRASTRKESVQW